MRLSQDELGEDSLARFGREIVDMLVTEHYEELAQRYRYAMAHGRAMASALREDFQLAHANGRMVPRIADVPRPGVRVSYFAPNESNLFALIECFVTFINNTQVLVELIVSTDGSDYYLCVEDISSDQWP